MTTDLFIWYNRDYLKKTGFPLRDKIKLFDTFDNKKNKFYSTSEWAVLSYRQMDFPPQEEKYKFPPKQFLIINQKFKEILFDYIEYHSDVKIVSENLLSFFREHGLIGGYETAQIEIVDKKGDILTDKKYFALRFGSYDDDFFDFNNKTKQRTKVHGSTNDTYPDLVLKHKDIKQSIFVLSELSYRNSLILTRDVLDKMLNNFYMPEIYRISDFPYIYENQYDLPFDNAYKLKKD